MQIHRGVAATVATAFLVVVGRTADAQDAHPLSLRDAVSAALASDADIYIAREELRAADDAILLARSAFAPRLLAETYWSRDDRPPTTSSLPALDTVTAGNVTLTGRIETGLTYNVTAGLEYHQRSDELDYSTIYSTGTTTTVRGEVVQPLRRGSFAAARRPIVVALLRRDQSAVELRGRLEVVIGNVYASYWELVRARAERDAYKAALDLAKDQVEEASRLKRVGTGSNLDVVEAEAGVMREQQELLRAEQDVVAAEGSLIQAMGVHVGDREWPVGQTIVPTDTPAKETSVPDVEAQLAVARTKRAEAIAARAAVAAETAELGVSDDQRHAAIDLVASAGTTGFAGSFASTLVAMSITPDPNFNGGVLTSLRNTGLHPDFRVYVGLRIELPLGNSKAEAEYAIQGRVLSRAQFAERGVLARIESEVRTAIARLAISAKAVESADLAVDTHEKLVEGMRKRFRMGASTTFDVLRTSEALTRTRVEAARARADYVAGRARLAAATGTLLESLGITISTLGAAPR